jgi:ABC-type nitrate/sulfonate/bicarbonate transport system substrate-binding protein
MPGFCATPPLRRLAGAGALDDGLADAAAAPLLRERARGAPMRAMVLRSLDWAESSSACGGL